MQMLLFSARAFSWASYSKTLQDVPDQDVDVGVEDAVVAFLHVESSDQAEDQQKRVFKHTLKHIKWIAGKRGIKEVVLHSFAHLGGANAEPEFAHAFMQKLDTRLTDTGYTVHQTPFGYFCQWRLDVYGDSLAKVYKAI